MFFHLIATAVKHLFAVIFPREAFVELDIVVPSVAVISDVLLKLLEGAAGLMAERRGRKSTGRPRKQPLNKSMEEDLIAENQRLKERIEYLEAENEYIKKLSALVYAEEQKSGKKRK